jgi:hypothetical protein
MNKSTVKTCETINYKIYIAGDYNVARSTINKFCFENGSCFTITPTTYVYTAGEETGIIVGIINYPRLPKIDSELLELAEKVGELLRKELNQDSFTIEGPDFTYFYSWRETRK